MHVWFALWHSKVTSYIFMQYVCLPEPLVQILQPAERSLEKQVQEFDGLELSCTVSIPDAPVRWFKDGLEVDETENLLLQAEGAERRLVILRTSVEDAGEYICETKDESVSFDVTVSGELSGPDSAVLKLINNPKPNLTQHYKL